MNSLKINYKDIDLFTYYMGIIVTQCSSSTLCVSHVSSSSNNNSRSFKISGWCSIWCGACIISVFFWFRLNSFSIPRHVLKRVKSNCSVTRPCHDVWKQFDRPQYHRHFDDTLSCGNLCLTLSFSKIASPHRIGRIKCLIEMKTHSGWQPANNAVHSTMNRSRRLSNFDAQYKRTKDFSWLWSLHGAHSFFNIFSIPFNSINLCNCFIFISDNENRRFTLFCCCSHSITHFLRTWQAVSIDLMYFPLALFGVAVDDFPFDRLKNKSIVI